MKCFGRDKGEPCVEEGTKTDPESPAVFVNPDDPTGRTIAPILCARHYARIMEQRDENEASWRRWR